MVSPTRAIDDDAPITAADVVAARRLLRIMGIVKPVVAATAIGFVVLVVISVAQASLARHKRFTWCMERTPAWHASLASGQIPGTAVVHRGLQGTVIEMPNAVVLVTDGEVVGSSASCGPAW